MIKSGSDGRSDSLVDWTNGKEGEGLDVVEFKGGLDFGAQATIARINNPRTLCILRLLMVFIKPFNYYAQNSMRANHKVESVGWVILLI